MWEGFRDMEKWSARMREPMERVYGAERLAKLWVEWIESVMAFYTHRNGDSCREELERIKAPTLIMHGKKDPMIAAAHIPYLRERIRDSKYHELPEGKHNIHLRYADEFNQLVTEFQNLPKVVMAPDINSWYR